MAMDSALALVLILSQVGAWRSLLLLETADAESAVAGWWFAGVFFFLSRGARHASRP